ncbi:MAG TPA: hypothetical protein DCE42_28300 [Myxococcales bacterium]|nr:hypothetical protein [Deltaproteobacteria bacterium]MBU49755.1 hypothetical protein [Deltaproteobacteria bacterium]HAA58697.1 hypothetical protein [Myxococcales bacterium]
MSDVLAFALDAQDFLFQSACFHRRCTDSKTPLLIDVYSLHKLSEWLTLLSLSLDKLPIALHKLQTHPSAPLREKGFAMFVGLVETDVYRM